MGKGRGPESTKVDDEGGGRTPFFVLAFLLFIGLLTLVTRSHVSAAGPPPATSRRYHGMSMGHRAKPPATGGAPPPPSPSSAATTAEEKARQEAVISKAAATAKKEFGALKKMLETYWKGEGILADSWAFPATHPEGIDAYAEKIARAIQNQIPLTMGVIGSSVAAGHDNCQYDSFENQLQRTMDPAFTAAGVKFTVRNAGQGGGCGDNMYNQVWCLSNMVGDDVDFTMYSWTYFEAGQNQRAKANIHEAFIRWSLLMKRGPIPSMLYAGDSIGSDLGDMFKKYAKFGFNVVSIRGGLSKHGQAKAPAWGDIGDSLHTTTRYGEKANETRKKSLGVFYRNWHPGPLGFQAVADAIAWRFTVAALKAVELLESGKRYGAEPDLVSTSALGQSSCQDFKDVPIWKAKWCDVEEPPNCINHEIPTFGRPQVVYSAKSDSLNPMHDRFVEELEEKKNGPSSLIPRDEKKGAECMHLDVCRGYRSDFMTYRLPRMSTGLIKVCCVNWGKCGEKLKLADFYLDSKKLPPPKQDNPDKCVIVEDKFNVAESTGGHFYLSIDMSKAPGVYISHVIAQ